MAGIAKRKCPPCANAGLHGPYPCHLQKALIMNSPRLYLAMDNCFAIKRWITPSQWMPLIKELGASSVEASTDNEIDPLFAPGPYMEDWVREVEEFEKIHGMKVRSFFTGYQTYRTAGLAHPDARVRDKLKNEWFKPLIKYSGRLQADIGFSFHAVQEEELRDPEKYSETFRLVVEEYAELAAFAWDNGGVSLCCEQMYAPYQTPWTVQGTKDLLKAVYAKGGRPFYTAVDVGHMVGQAKYRKPTREEIIDAVKRLRAGEKKAKLWLGPIPAFEKLHRYAAGPAGDDSAFASELLAFIEQYPYMFAPPEDSDPFHWTTELGPYSPIFHLQQTDGISSPHAPFTSETNKKGIITGKRLLTALADGYARPEEPGMPPRTDRITLAFEIFISNTQYPYDSLTDLKETVAQWKEFIPTDGMTLDEAMKRLK